LTAGLTIGGIGGWRLPSADVNGDGTVVDCFGGGLADCADNEMGYLYWEEGVTGAAPGPFQNLEPGVYWSGTELAPNPNNAWSFSFLSGIQFIDIKNVNANFAWAVHSGDVSAVPIPAAVWLFGSGLLGLIGIARTRKAV
jgi:hypothetical protein